MSKIGDVPLGIVEKRGLKLNTDLSDINDHSGAHWAKLTCFAKRYGTMRCDLPMPAIVQENTPHICIRNRVY